MGGEITESSSNGLSANRHPFSSSSASSNFGQPLCWSVPTRIEVETAIAALQSFLGGLMPLRSASDAQQPNLRCVDPRILQSPGSQRVYAAFRLLQTAPYVQRMVSSIVSDKAVWDAVLNNNEVQKFQQFVTQGKPYRAEGPNVQEPDFIAMILRWILDNMKLKVVELIAVLKTVVSNSSGSRRKDNSSPGRKQQFEEMICSTALLSIITLMIVLVSRVYGS